MKLETLTQEQIDLMPVVAEKWKKWALAPTYRDAAIIQKNMEWLYKQVGIEKAPVTVCNTLAEFRDSVRASVGASVGASVWDSVWASVRASVGASVRASVGASVWDSVRDSVGAYYWAGDIAFGSYFEEIGILTDAKLLQKRAKYIDILSDIALGFHTDKQCIVLTKPVVTQDAQDRLHNEYDRAVKWAKDDGFYYLDGVKLEKDVWSAVMTKQMPFAEIMAIENADERAVALKYNPDSMLNEAVLIDKSERGNELYLIEGKELNEFLDEPEVWMLKMDCPTGRTFVEGVPPSFANKHRSADMCQAAALGLTIGEYGLLRNEG